MGHTPERQSHSLSKEYLPSFMQSTNTQQLSHSQRKRRGIESVPKSNQKLATYLLPGMSTAKASSLKKPGRGSVSNRATLPKILDVHLPIASNSTIAGKTSRKKSKGNRRDTESDYYKDSFASESMMTPGNRHQP